jgi:hypothetical protein
LGVCPRKDEDPSAALPQQHRYAAEIITVIRDADVRQWPVLADFARSAEAGLAPVRTSP